jgi:hypothetical protein
MFPEWAIKILAASGLAGVVIFLETLAIGALVAYIKSLQTKADKVYGFRLAERDTLNETLSNVANVLRDVLKATDERNDITAEQAELIVKQAQAFELLKITILAQYDNIHDYNKATAQAVASMAESIRTLSSMVLENRTIATAHVQAVQAVIQDLRNEMVKAVRDTADGTVKEMRSLLGNVTRIEHRRKKSP